MSNTKSALQSPTIISNSTVGVVNLIMIIQHVATGGTLLALDPVLLANGLSFILSQYSTYRRINSDNKPIRKK